jgi:hypothetical protein
VQAFALFGRGQTLASQGECELALADCQRAMATAPDAFTRASARGMAGKARLEKGEPEAARSLVEEAIESFRASGNRRMEQRWIAFLGEAELACGHLDRARHLAHEALATSVRSGARWHIAVARRTRGRIDHATGSLADASGHHDLTLALFTEIGAVYEQARTLLHLAEVSHARGESRTTARCVGCYGPGKPRRSSSSPWVGRVREQPVRSRADRAARHRA